MSEREQRVTPLELFFDLVFVFAITQVTSLMAADPTWAGIGRGLLVLTAVWWTWAAYAWLTNTLEPEEVGVRVAMFAAMAAMLVVALAVPGAFGDHGVLFGVAYLAVRLLHIVLYLIPGKQDRDLLGAVVRFAPTALLSSALLIVAGFVDGAPQAGLWLAAIVIDYLGGLAGRGRGWRVSPAHFAERHGLIVIIALGESLIAVGIGAAGIPLSAGVVVAAVLGIAIISALWWAHFDVIAVMAQRQLTERSGAVQVRLARDVYSYLHLPLIAGIVLFALGAEKTIEHVGDPLDTIPAVALCGGLALYYFSHVAFRLRVDRSFGPGRTVATIVLLALTPAALELPALAALALVAAVCCGLIVYDVMHYREDRAQVRLAR
jgi:low temperature requirement protein LtrA